MKKDKDTLHDGLLEHNTKQNIVRLDLKQILSSKRKVLRTNLGKNYDKMNSLREGITLN